MKKKTKKRLILLSAAVLLNIVLNTFGNALQTLHYTLISGKITTPVRIVFISDLHNCTYGGKEQSEILDEIRTAAPDIVLFGGDVIDFQGNTENAHQLMKLTKESYPCAYASGNHEALRKDTDTFYAETEALGIPVLHGTYTDFTVNGQNLRICGIMDAIDHPEQLEQCCDALHTDQYTVLLAHQPEQLDVILEECVHKNAHFDLILSGHAHGGQWRIPDLLEQGLYAPDQGLFPEFTNGQREFGGTFQIVSRGLAKPLRMILIPRIFNRPELSVIEILPA